MNNHQSTTFHQLGYFIKTCRSLAWTSFNKIPNLAKSVILLIIPIYAKVSMNRTKNLNYNYLPKKDIFTFPLFKFLKPEHVKNMLEMGEVYIPNIESFRKSNNSENPNSTINDINEGCFPFSLKGDFNGEAKYLPKGLPHLFHPNQNLNIKNLTWNGNNTLPDVLIYCCSGQLLSDSTLWALKEGKTSCVMILDTKKFRQSIQE
ncbi:Mobile element protein [uncultured Candidatus Thioglobus sp.]|nr:Mobile element protein [uncultured Candidatus Thioglobus sp.]